MGRLPLERTVDGVIAREPVEVLRRHGFRRKGRTFHRTRGSFVDSAWFQTMRGNPSAFCVNLTLIQPEHHRIWSGRALSSSPSADNSVFLANVRVAFDTADGENHWWIIQSEEETASIASHVATCLESNLAFFDEWRSLDDVIGSAERGKDERFSVCELDLPILLAAQGDSQRAVALLKTIPVESAFADVVLRLKEKLGARKP